MKQSVRNCRVGAALALALVFVLVLGPATGGASEGLREWSIVGHARHPDTGRLLYTEIHRQQVGSESDQVQTATYLDPDGQVIAQRTVRFEGEGTTPSFTIEDLRRNGEQGVRVEGDELVAFRKRPGKERSEERRVAREPTLITGPGLDRLVTASWPQLVAGETVVADMLVPERLRTIRFEMLLSEEGSLWGEPVVTFRMRFTNPLIRLVAGPIDVTYHRDFRVVMRYAGMSNIKGPDGGNYRTVIEFPLHERTDWWGGSEREDNSNEAR